MVSTTMEKTFFIGLGLVMCTVLFVPIHAMVNEIIAGERIVSSFHRAGDAFEAGLRMVEQDQDRQYQLEIPAMIEVSVQNNGWLIVLSYKDESMILERRIIAQKFPVMIPEECTSGPRTITIHYESLFIHVGFMET